MLVGTVADTFEIQGRGLIVATDTPLERLPRDLKLKIGDLIEFRSASRAFRSRVAGIEHCDPWSPKHSFAFLLPREVAKTDVLIGAEIWVANQHEADCSELGSMTFLV